MLTVYFKRKPPASVCAVRNEQGFLTPGVFSCNAFSFRIATPLFPHADVNETYTLYPPPVWNVHDATIRGTERTNNSCEGWNNGMAGLVGHQHPSVFHLVSVLQQDAALAETLIVQDVRGQHRPSGSDVPCSSIIHDCSSCASTSAMAARLCRRP